jgi:hypothetical protein
VKLNLASYINQTVSICIPAIDEQARPYRLLGVELYGLWLQGDDPTGGMLVAELETDPPTPTTLTAFVPFTQIGAVVVAAVPAFDGTAAKAGPAQTTARTPPETTTGQATPATGDGARRRRDRRKAS